MTPNASLAPPFAPVRVETESRTDGSLLMRSTEPLARYPPSLTEAFRAGAERHPDRPLAAERSGEAWTALSWGAAREAADAIATSLLDADMGPDRPLMILSGNGLAHLKVMLGAFTAGVPIMPISTAYSLLSSDHARVRSIAELCRPGMVFAEDAEAFGPALDSLADLVPRALVARGSRPLAHTLAEFEAAPVTDRLERAVAAVGPDSLAKILFTSGSTRTPKGVINTHRMLCSNQQALAQIWPFLREEPPALVDWLPWSHTFGGNHNLNQILCFGGTLHIDDGRPVPALFERTVEALRHSPPTVYYNVPAGYALLTPRLEGDPEFAKAFFSRLRFMFYAAAALPDALWQRLRAVADAVADRHVALTSSWGTTETAPLATSAHFLGAPCGCIGVPVPGVTLKLTPEGDKREIRLKGPNVTPGYVGDPQATASAFDAEGFYLTGDAVRLVDEGDPSKGLMFDGRLAEDFKLMTGTWVHVGKLRSELLSSAVVLSDAAIAGHDRAYVAAIAWLNQTEARRVLGREEDVPVGDPGLRSHLAVALGRHNDGAGSARRIERLLLLDQLPDIDAGEITDKGYLNQRGVLSRRGDDVESLFRDPVDPRVNLPATD